MVIQEVSFRREVVTFTAQSRSTTPAPARQCTDSVSLSSEATAGTKAEALVTALDADKDGAISDQEFVDGGTALLRRASHRWRAQDDDSEKAHGAQGHRSHRFERRLERVFDKVDTNGDGALDVDELTAALSGAAAPPAPTQEETATEPPAEAATEGQSSTGFTSVTFQFTFVSIAVRQYQASGQEPAPPQPQLQASA